MQWNAPAYLNQVRGQLARNFVRAGVYYVSQTRGFLNVDQPYTRAKVSGKHRGLSPSKPGQYPRKLSGQLQRSITWTFDATKLELTVGSNLKGYPSFLQTGTRFMQLRPWLSLSFTAERDKLAQIILGV